MPQKQLKKMVQYQLFLITKVSWVGIGSQYELKNDDMVTFDIGVTYQKYICDAAFTIVLDKKNEKANAINDAT